MFSHSVVIQRPDVTPGEFCNGQDKSIGFSLTGRKLHERPAKAWILSHWIPTRAKLFRSPQLRCPPGTCIRLTDPSRLAARVCEDRQRHCDVGPKTSHAAHPIKTRPATLPTNRSNGAIFSNKTRRLSPATHNKFITPKANRRAINAQQHFLGNGLAC